MGVYSQIGMLMLELVMQWPLTINSRRVDRRCLQMSNLNPLSLKTVFLLRNGSRLTAKFRNPLFPDVPEIATGNGLENFLTRFNNKTKQSCYWSRLPTK